MPHARTVSALFSDVVGSTEFLTRLGDVAADDLRRAHHLAQAAAVTENRGEVVKSLGDGLMAVFDGAADAVDAAVAIQDASARIAAEYEVNLRVRVGIASGDASTEDGDWHGTPIVEASRLCAAARGGQVLVADLSRRLAGSRTRRTFASLGSLALKGLPEPVVVHEVVGTPAPAAASTAVRREREPAGALSELRLAGAFAIHAGGVPISEAALGSRKARRLIKLLAVRRGQFVPMDTIVEALWDDAPPAKAAENVSTLVSRLRGVIGADVIEGGRTGYRLVLPAGCRVDVDEAQQLVAEAETRVIARQPALGVTAVDRALELVGDGRLLAEEPDAPWADDANRDLQRLVRRARAAAWQCRLALEDYRGALAVAERAVEFDPLDEEALRAVMTAYYRHGEPGEALAAYKHLRDVLVEELGADPGPDTEALYLSILRGEPLASDAAAVAPRAAGTGFVGRADELAALVDTWSAAAAGRASCALITGDAGIGKTRLAAELMEAARATGALVVETRCFGAERSLFLQPIVEVIRTVVATVPPELVREAAGDWAGALAGLVPDLRRVAASATPYEPSGGEVERRRVFEAVASFFAALSRRRPLLIVLDDLHQAGASTIELCHFVVRWEPAARLLIAATLRADEGGEAIASLQPIATTLKVGPLDADAIRAMAAQAGREDLASELVQMTGGHTLFALEVLRAVTAGDGQGDELPVPDSLRSAVITRADQCGKDVVELLRASVVVGTAFGLDDVVSLLDITLEEAARRAEIALQARLLREAGTGYEFDNDLIRDVLYESVPAPTRAVRHRRLATLFADQPERAGHHASAAGDRSLAADYWIDAANRALAAFANAEADGLLTRALDTIEELGDATRANHVRRLRAAARAAIGRYGEAMEDLVAAEAMARESGDDAGEAAAIAELGLSAYYARDMPLARESAERAAAHPASGAEARLLLARVRHADGDLVAAENALAPLTEAADDTIRARATTYLASVLVHRGRFDDAVVMLDQATNLARRIGLLRPMLQALMCGAIARAELGDLGTALSWAEQLRNSAQRYDAPPYVPRALNILAMVWRELDEPSKARDLSTEALELAAPGGRAAEAEPAAHALIGLAESAVMRGDGADAFDHLGRIGGFAAGIGFAWRIELHRLELMCRLDAGNAERLLDEARRQQSPKYEALAHMHLGRWDDAVGVARATGSEFLVARVAPAAIARRLLEAVADRLPPELREGFARRFADS